MHKKLITACMALAAFAAFVVLPATASAVNKPVITHPTGTVLNPGANGIKIKSTNIGEVLLTTEAGGGSVLTRCGVGNFTGTLIKNEKNTVEGNIETSEFSGTGAGTDCTSSFGDIKVTTNVGNGTPWCLRSDETMANDEIQVIGGSCGGTKRSVTFRLDVTLGFECNYVSARNGAETNTIKGTYTTDTEPELSDLIIHIKGQEFIGEAGNSFLCPTKGFLQFSSTLETDTTAANDPLYAS
jgi:hypothetical protein